ncbi:hypothetical protein [Gymnodinialimonas ceratoperidinii]|uniref:Uncharacterized protein n=1 Tax=Gymnodinialimonas ceratoperidinii TaxID=2856823 RepID=A0A8F6TUG5_9RHOB|nr:hypothetical protein [Gymnodinialimonas ceratoperidinii]QXT38084.1 hypothetical protein KYE46_08925 [Gymnodinialimonas ceratoperidinii]
MEYSSLVPRTEPAGLPASTSQNFAPSALSTAAETARPVLAVAKTDAADAKTGEEFQPLDTFEVGDNDHVPVPPEPPREATVRAIIADAPEIEEVEEPADPEDPIAATLRDMEADSKTPTVDVRS